MAKAKVSSKAAEKKKERLEMQKKVDARIKFVNAANKQEDPLGALPSFKVMLVIISKNCLNTFWEKNYVYLHALILIDQFICHSSA